MPLRFAGRNSRQQAAGRRGRLPHKPVPAGGWLLPARPLGIPWVKKNSPKRKTGTQISRRCWPVQCEGQRVPRGRGTHTDSDGTGATYVMYRFGSPNTKGKKNPNKPKNPAKVGFFISHFSQLGLKAPRSRSSPISRRSEHASGPSQQPRPCRAIPAWKSAFQGCIFQSGRARLNVCFGLRAIYLSHWSSAVTVSLLTLYQVRTAPG